MSNNVKRKYPVFQAFSPASYPQALDELRFRSFLLAHPSFLRKVFRKVPDAEGRVLETLERGSINVIQDLRPTKNQG